MELVELKCKNCGSQLSKEDFSEQLSAVRCHHCNALYAISLPQPAAGAPHVNTGPRPEVPMPKHVTVRTAGANLEIVRRWFNPGYFFLLFFALLWNGFMVFWHVMAISQGAWVMSLFGLIHTAVGVGLAYTVLAGFLNSTVITVGHGVSIKHAPLPWKGAKAIPRDQVDQVYCIEKIHRGKNGTATTYQVVVRDAAGKKQTLLKRLMDADQALFVEQQIERFLGIKDTYVHGELPR